MALPITLCPWIDRQWHYDDGAPLDGGKVEFFVTGTVTHKPIYEDALKVTPSVNPVILDSAGRATVFLDVGGYDISVFDKNDVPLYTVENYEDIGATFLATLGVQLATGAAGVTSGYSVLVTDLTVTVASTGGADPCVINLPAAATHPQPLLIKNLGTVVLSVTPNGAETIDGVAAVYTVPVAASPQFPSIWLLPVASGWLIAASHQL
jgi:hypothetical protein